MEPRHITLLRAARDLITKQKNSHFVLDLTAETVFYDGADCDGSCLLDDINAFLDEDSTQDVVVPWISCKDEMPDPLEQVIGYFPKAKRWAVLGWNGLYWDSPSGFVRYTKEEVSHWISVQKLPLRQILDLKGDEF